MAGDKQTGAGIRRTEELTAAECWRLLAGTSLGRIVFTRMALPAIRPVNHLVEDRTIIIRSHMGAAIVYRAASGGGTVVCYEADDLDPVEHTGWSVIATGTAQLVRDPAAIARYQRELEPWAASGDMDYVIAVEPQMITGLRISVPTAG
jgi:nitroimidazol reductase NimA-like FMN-containing flavoprotein (pyridoxamine 5'-phosphate oxidase superfamily)